MLHMQIGLLFFVSGFWGFFPLFQAIFTFPQELLMLEKERSSGMYRLSSYFMSRVVADLQMELSLPSIFIHTLLLHVLVSQDLGASVMDQKMQPHCPHCSCCVSCLLVVFMFSMFWCLFHGWSTFPSATTTTSSLSRLNIAMARHTLVLLASVELPNFLL